MLPSLTSDGQFHGAAGSGAHLVGDGAGVVAGRCSVYSLQHEVLAGHEDASLQVLCDGFILIWNRGDYRKILI